MSLGDEAWYEWLEPARERELARLRMAWKACRWALNSGRKHYQQPDRDGRVRYGFREASTAELKLIEYKAELAKSPEWLATRPGRRLMPSLQTVAEYWLQRDGSPFDDDPVGIGKPHCIRCGFMHRWVIKRGVYWPTPAWDSASAWLDRAHLVDRDLGGLDGPQNVVPLCLGCHKIMPSFGSEEGPEALWWVSDRKF